MKVTQTQLAEIFNVSTRTIRDWDKAGCPSITENKTKHYLTEDVINWRIKKEVEDSGEGLALITDDEEVRQAQRRQQLAKADSAEADAEIKRIEVGKRKKDVVPRDNVEDLFNDVVSGICQALQRVPYRYVGELGAARTDNERREILKKSMDEAQLEISRLANFENEHADD